jgi:hypothetical protein
MQQRTAGPGQAERGAARHSRGLPPVGTPVPAWGDILRAAAA